MGTGKRQACTKLRGTASKLVTPVLCVNLHPSWVGKEGILGLTPLHFGVSVACVWGTDKREKDSALLYFYSPGHAEGKMLSRDPWSSLPSSFLSAKAGSCRGSSKPADSGKRDFFGLRLSLKQVTECLLGKSVLSQQENRWAKGIFTLHGSKGKNNNNNSPSSYARKKRKKKKDSHRFLCL